MELRDLIVTPVWVILVYLGAYFIRPYVTDNINRRYFLPALTLKILGAIALGLLYTYYYDGGDTFKYHTYGSRQMYEVFLREPIDAFKLLFSGRSDNLTFNKYITSIFVLRDPPSFNVARIAFVFDLFTFSTYSATAVFFSVFSFAGLWLFFLAFYEESPSLHRWIAVATLFIPSVIFWGSGIMKDTVTLGALGASTFLIRSLFIKRKISFIRLLLLVFFLLVIYTVKKYILLCLIPAALVWVFASNLYDVRSRVLRVVLVPFFFGVVYLSGNYAVTKIGEDDEKYSTSNLAKTAMITAYDIRYQTGKDAGSGYSLGELDGTLGSLVRLMPEAINVSLFRPYLWEVRNPLMLLSSIESSILLVLTIVLLFKSRMKIFSRIAEPKVLFCLLFSISFAFAVGVSTFNFGTLTRYRIPMIPFYLLALIFLLEGSNNDKKFDELEETE